MSDDATTVLTRIANRIPNDLALFQQGFAAELFNEIQSGRRYSTGTPIDTGFARANWDGGPGAAAPRRASVTAKEARENQGRGRAAAAQRAQEATAALVGVALGEPQSIWNTAPYIRRLEMGSSTQAPKGFVRTAVQSAQRIANDVARHITAMRGR